MLSNKEIICPDNLLNVAQKKKGIKAGIVNAGKPLPMLSVQDAVNENLIEPIFIGDEKEILKCADNLKWDISNFEIIHEPIENNTAAIAAKLASEKKIRIIVKGHIHTDVLMKEVLDSVPSSKDAEELTKLAKKENLSADVFGPMAFDNCISKKSAAIKGIKNDVAGIADVLLVPSVETGNGLVKMLIYFLGACAAGVVVGGKIPVVITSRSDEAQARLASIAAAVVALD